MGTTKRAVKQKASKVESPDEMVFRNDEVLARKVQKWKLDGFRLQRPTAPDVKGLVASHDEWRARLWIGKAALVPSRVGTTFDGEDCAHLVEAEPQAVPVTAQNLGLFTKTLTQLASENNRYALDDVLIEFFGEGDAVRLTVTDGHHLASMRYSDYNAESRGFARPDASVHVSASGLSFLLDAIGKHRAIPRVGLAYLPGTKQRAAGVALYGATTVVAALYEGSGEWPPYRAVLPDNDYDAFVPNDFADAVNAMRRVSSPKDAELRVTITPGDEPKWALLQKGKHGIRATCELTGVAGECPGPFVAYFDPYKIVLFDRLIRSRLGTGLKRPVRMRYTDQDRGVKFEWGTNDYCVLMPLNVEE